MRLLTTVLLASSLALSACASLKKSVDEDTEAASEATAPEIIKALPTEVGSFNYEGYRYFKDESTGYTFRYTNPRKHRMADVYVYQVSKENSDLDHDDLVMGSTRATIQAIGEAVKQGLYTDFNVVGAATQARGIRTVARVEATYLRQNLASYTLVYQTEYDGTLLKIRVSMPDNESNRDSLEWDEFANTMFNAIIEDLDDTRAAESASKPAVKPAPKPSAKSNARPVTAVGTRA